MQGYGHARTQGTVITDMFDENFESAARRIDDRAEVTNACDMLLVREVSGSDFELLPVVQASEQPFREREPHQEWCFGGDPEKTFAPSDVLAFAHVTTGNQAAKRGRHFGFLEFQFQGALLLLSGVALFGD